jgi:hypothetical protein
MRFPLLVLALFVVGCTTTTTTTDLSVIPTGCRQPSSCWSTSCGCLRADVQSGGCLLCDPTQQASLTCDCTSFDAGAMCSEPAQVCVGRGPVCPGVGARCLPGTKQITVDGGSETVPSVCSDPNGEPPQMVPIGGDADAGPGSEPRCAFVDDVCCPGALPDGGANVDQSIPDLAEPDLAKID